MEPEPPRGAIEPSIFSLDRKGGVRLDADKTAEMTCGVAVVGLASGKNLGTFEFTEGCDDLYDTHFLPGPTRPGIINMSSPAAKQGISTPEFAYWLHEKPKEDAGKDNARGTGASKA